ncbi:hypothetical protein [Vibrio rotiferianus]|uniref:hypothetical protein n=1 Tax=Vibrio rotiferianus TaxID=190895 RepID=UPI00289522E4|nr:conserved hypothetical protein [Vibrio rotiferianus]CAH1559577.1 conserved hypothetical protein [Vibrio rotiferianus]
MTKFSVAGFFGSLIIAVVAGVASGYATVGYYGEQLERTKTKLRLEEINFKNELELLKDVLELAGTLHMDSSLYRAVDIISPANEEILKEAKERLPYSVSEREIIALEREFAATLFAAQPFIDKSVYEDFSMYMILMNKFISDRESKGYALELQYKDASKYYLSAVEKIRSVY